MKERTAEQMNASQWLYENVKFLARMHKLRLQDVEKAVGVSKGFFSRARSRHDSVSAKTLCALADYFGVTIDSLISDGLQQGLRRRRFRKELARVLDQADGLLSGKELTAIVLYELKERGVLEYE